jgi:hypothetical protein
MIIKASATARPIPWILRTTARVTALTRESTHHADIQSQGGHTATLGDSLATRRSLTSRALWPARTRSH